jgi:hypothetical protein
MRIAIRALWLVCALFLVLPPGWCCFILEAQAVDSSADAAPAKSKKTCCCDHESKPEPKPPKDRPARCLTCYLPLDSLKPSAAPKFTPDAACVPLAVLLPPIVAGAGNLLPLCRDASPPSSSLHVLHCVWLC